MKSAHKFFLVSLSLIAAAFLMLAPASKATYGTSTKGPDNWTYYCDLGWYYYYNSADTNTAFALYYYYTAIGTYNLFITEERPHLANFHLNHGYAFYLYYLSLGAGNANAAAYYYNAYQAYAQYHYYKEFGNHSAAKAFFDYFSTLASFYL